MVVIRRVLNVKHTLDNDGSNVTEGEGGGERGRNNDNDDNNDDNDDNDNDDDDDDDGGGGGCGGDVHDGPVGSETLSPTTTMMTQ